MNESVVTFGDASALVGVVTQAAEGVPQRPGVVLLNAGLLHHVGPNRLYVRLARALAAAGHPCLRFDYSGLGDSARRRDGMTLQESTLVEARQAMDELARVSGARTFVLMGLCSGADNALRVAGVDTRVVGALMIDGYAFTNPLFYLKSYARRLRQPRSWLKLVTGRSELWTIVAGAIMQRMRPAAAEASDDDWLDWRMPSSRETIAEVGRLGERGVALCFVYADGTPAHTNYRWRFARAFRRLAARAPLGVTVVRGADHLFTPLAAQHEVAEVVQRWAAALAPDAAAVPPVRAMPAAPAGPRAVPRAAFRARG